MSDQDACVMFSVDLMPLCRPSDLTKGGRQGGEASPGGG